MKTQTSEIRIYVASLADYNAGRLHGRWIDLGSGVDGDDIRGEIKAMLAESCEPVAEEWAVHDHEGFGGVLRGEWPDLDYVAALAAALEEHGEAFRIFLASGCTDDGDIDAAVSDFEEAYAGEWDSREDFAYKMVDECGVIPPDAPDILRSYFDYGAFARDLFLGDYWEYGGHVFRNL